MNGPGNQLLSFSEGARERVCGGVGRELSFEHVLFVFAFFNLLTCGFSST